MPPRRTLLAALAAAAAAAAWPAAAHAQLLDRLRAAARASAETALDTVVRAPVRGALGIPPGGPRTRGAARTSAGAAGAIGEPAGPTPAGCATNATYQCARAVRLGGAADGVIGSRHVRRLYYRVDVPAPGTLDLRLDPMPNGGAVNAALADAQYRELASFRFGAGQPGGRLHAVTAPGTYYVSLFGLGPTAEPFALAVRHRPAFESAAGEVAAPGAGCATNHTFQCALPLAVGERVEGVIGSANTRHLFYRTDAARPGPLWVRLDPAPNDGAVVVSVTDERYRELARLAFGPGRPAEQPAHLAAPGRYFVRLFGPGRSAEPFALQLRTR